MLEQRFNTPAGKLRLVEILKGNKLVGGDSALAEALAEQGAPVSFQTGEKVIVEGDTSDTHAYFVVSGQFAVKISGQTVAVKQWRDHFGFMEAISPALPRSAEVEAMEPSLALRLRSDPLEQVAGKFPALYRNYAGELVLRINHSNKLYRTTVNPVPRVIIFSSAESLNCALGVQHALSVCGGCEATTWSAGIFSPSSMTLPTLIDQMDEFDFAIAVTAADDATTSRGQCFGSTRDNVVFEFGLAVGHLGLSRSLLMVPRDLHMPSDLKGLTTVPYQFETGAREAESLLPACTEIRRHIQKLGPRIKAAKRWPA